jgi:prolipoprotein diacylglyceryltransferase
MLGMAIGRVGCFLTGLSDHTYGLPTRLPWAVDFGDGIPRHPTQLYDVVFLLILAIALLAWVRKPRVNGRVFGVFLGSYLVWRFGVEFIKPTWKPYLGLSAIQIASFIGAALIFYRIVRSVKSVALDERRVNLEGEAPGIRPHPSPLAGSRQFRSLLPKGEGARGRASECDTTLDEQAM